MKLSAISGGIGVGLLAYAVLMDIHVLPLVMFGIGALLIFVGLSGVFKKPNGARKCVHFPDNLRDLIAGKRMSLGEVVNKYGKSD